MKRGRHRSNPGGPCKVARGASPLDDFAPDVENDEMHLLNVRRRGTRDCKGVARTSAVETDGPGQRECHRAVAFRGGESPENIGRLPAGGKGNRQIAGLRECFHLALEDRCEVEVIGDASGDAGIARERDSREPATWTRSIKAEQLAGEMRRL